MKVGRVEGEGKVSEAIVSKISFSSSYIWGKEVRRGEATPASQLPQDLGRGSGHCPSRVPDVELLRGLCGFFLIHVFFFFYQLFKLPLELQPK